MKNIPKWLDEALSRSKKEDQAIKPDNGNPEEPDLGVDLPKELRDFLAEGPMPDIYADATEVTDPNINIVDPDAPAGDKETGFNPYDTVRMHKK